MKISKLTQIWYNKLATIMHSTFPSKIRLELYGIFSIHFCFLYLINFPCTDSVVTWGMGVHHEFNFVLPTAVVVCFVQIVEGAATAWAVFYLRSDGVLHFLSRVDRFSFMSCDKLMKRDWPYTLQHCTMYQLFWPHVTRSGVCIFFVLIPPDVARVCHPSFDYMSMEWVCLMTTRVS